jgi:hypothetical protein
MRSMKARRLTKAELRAAGASPGLLLHRVGPNGSARLEQLAPESDERRRSFAMSVLKRGWGCWADNVALSRQAESAAGGL